MKSVARKYSASYAQASDVVVENLRPGSMSRMGIGQKEMRDLNPKLIWAIISGFGRLEGYKGPYSDRPAFDIVAEAMSGIMHVVGFEDKPPSWTIYGLADIYSGQVAAYGIMQALFMRERTGEGQLVDSAMFDNMLALNEAMAASVFCRRSNPGTWQADQCLAAWRVSGQGRLYRAECARQHHMGPACDSHWS